MKTINTITALFLCFSISAIGQSLNPQNNSADAGLLKSGESEMQWIMINNGTEIPFGNLKTKIEKGKELTHIITTVNVSQMASAMVDTTIVKTASFEPVYHSSYNQQRDMVLKFDSAVTGYYLDKTANSRKEISESPKAQFFDSNFYPQLIRVLPLETGYQEKIAIFDYNPKAKVGVMTATIKNVEESTIEVNGQVQQVWKVTTTDDISDNTSTVTYYIAKTSRDLLQQEIEMGGRKMLMRLVD